METGWSVEDRLAIYSEHKLRAENLPFDIDVWYPALEKFTFRTEFIPLRRFLFVCRKS